jgi:hypothetical protein
LRQATVEEIRTAIDAITAKVALSTRATMTSHVKSLLSELPPL